MALRILLLHPNYHSGGAEIAGNWPPAWAAYIFGALKQAGYADVTFIDAMTFNIPDDVLRGVLHNYRRFYFKKATGGYLWDKDPYRRKYLRGCLKAYLKSAFERRFYDLGRINFWGQKTDIDWGFDESKVHDKSQMPVLDEIQKVFTNDEFHPKRRSVNKRPTAKEVRACGGPDDSAAVATLEPGENEEVGGYIAQAIRASEVDEARMMGCPTDPTPPTES